jgi:hypothetical protein
MRLARLSLPLCFSVFLLAQAPLNLRNMDLDAIDTTCKACDDFYQYSVGKWLTDHPIPANQSRWGKRWAGADQNLVVLKSVMDDLATTNPKPGTDLRLLGDFKAACMDTAAIDALGARPLERILKRIQAITERPSLDRRSMCRNSKERTMLGPLVDFTTHVNYFVRRQGFPARHRDADQKTYRSVLSTGLPSPEPIKPSIGRQILRRRYLVTRV